MDSKELANVFEENADKLALLLVQTQGKDESQQERIARIVKLLRKENSK